MLTIQFSKNDQEMLELVKKEFPNSIIYEAKGFDVTEFIFTVVIPITALTFQILSFILENIRDKEDRKLISKGKALDLCDKSKREIAEEISIKCNITVTIDWTKIDNG